MKCLLFLLSVGCVSDIRVDPKIVESPKSNYCLQANVSTLAGMEIVTACMDKLETCNRAMNLAKRFGEYAKIKSVSTCVPRIVIYK